MPIYFKPGHVVATNGVVEKIPEEELITGLRRHLACDWGEMCDEDKVANNRALMAGLRLMSAYLSSSGVKYWIITEADRSVTTLLLPEEY